VAVPTGIALPVAVGIVGVAAGPRCQTADLVFEGAGNGNRAAQCVVAEAAELKKTFLVTRVNSFEGACLSFGLSTKPCADALPGKDSTVNTNNTINRMPGNRGSIRDRDIRFTSLDVVSNLVLKLYEYVCYDA
jgi:hypothetical protein